MNIPVGLPIWEVLCDDSLMNIGLPIWEVLCDDDSVTDLNIWEVLSDNKNDSQVSVEGS